MHARYHRAEEPEHPWLCPTARCARSTAARWRSGEVGPRHLPPVDAGEQFVVATPRAPRSPHRRRTLLDPPLQRPQLDIWEAPNRIPRSGPRSQRGQTSSNTDLAVLIGCCFERERRLLTIVVVSPRTCAKGSSRVLRVALHPPGFSLLDGALLAPSTSSPRAPSHQPARLLLDRSGRWRRGRPPVRPEVLARHQ